MTPTLKLVPLGYNQITGPSNVGLAQGMTNNAIPDGANFAVISVETQAVRWRDDGTAPTAAVGMPIAAGGSLEYSGTLANFKLIQQTAGAVVNVAFYRIAG